jgi:plastocyanin
VAGLLERRPPMKIARHCIALVLAFGVLTPVAAKEVKLKVGHGTLDPARVEIEKGDSVVFENTEEMAAGHTVVAEDGSFSSPALKKGEKWSRTFDKAGTFKIQVKEHPTGRGEIVVE